MKNKDFMKKIIEIFFTLTNLQQRIKKTPAANERFHASGGADSSDTEQVTSSFALVRALPMPPPA